MASFNKVILLGNLTRDPETRVTVNGNTICKLGMAVSRVYSTKDGERREETTFVDIDAFGKQAEVITKYMRKGRPLMVEGRLKLDQWETNDGQKRSKLGVVLENFQFVGGRDDNDSSGGSGSGGGYEQSSPPRRESKPAASQDFSAEGDTLDEDVPF
ncbi:single-stranded DNA-binding protein [Coraliomargarita algicola]|uniref:Single-stranded DNA-binding protein n=1 Tax=Coraliomargarita algicola TaxID=3092156 RepID=A0ABZ0RR55_9BACT|nr:single-stranded DNA-binding protein [Coraliomargarita sp. J2-16]WPJ97583.1 single-stranded DNA-binding protein [Coraliomargarita sp. J2-16]